MTSVADKTAHQALSRIPSLADDSRESVINWFLDMAMLNLDFHPEDDPAEVISPSGYAECRGPDYRVFSDVECAEVSAILETIRARYGDEIFDLMNGGPHFLVVRAGHWTMPARDPVAVVVELGNDEIDRLQTYCDIRTNNPLLRVAEFEFDAMVVNKPSDFLLERLSEMDQTDTNMLLVPSPNGDLDDFGESEGMEFDFVRVVGNGGLFFGSFSSDDGSVVESQGIDLTDLKQMWQSAMVGDPSPSYDTTTATATLQP